MPATKHTEPSNAETPWGNATFVHHFGDGIDFYQTQHGGGFHVSGALNGRVPEYMRNADGWYEKERDWAVVAAVFPDRFTPCEMDEAYRTMRNWRPDDYERFYSILLLPGESLKRDNERRLAERLEEVFPAVRAPRTFGSIS